MRPKQMKAIATNPMDYIRFTTTGRLPRLVRPEGPLIDLLRAIAPRDRVRITGLRVDSKLGYTGSRMFQTAEQALRWCAPDDEMLERESWPAESWRDKRFRGPISIDTLVGNASSYPEELKERYARWRATW